MGLYYFNVCTSLGLSSSFCPTGLEGSSQLIGSGFFYLVCFLHATCKKLGAAAVQHLKNAGGPAGLG